MTDKSRAPLILNQETLRGPLGEAYRVLYANIRFNSIEHPAKTIAVMSASGGEGRTTTALNLSIVIAEAGCRVVFVEADFRRPTIGDAVLLQPGGAGDGRPVRGLSSVMAGLASVGDVVQVTTVNRLFVLPAGAIPDKPGEVIGSEGMKALVHELSGQVDYVILDTPPSLMYADALLIAGMVDGVLYVLRAGPQDRDAQQRAYRQLQQANARILGVAFNDLPLAEIAGYPHQHTNGQKGAGRRLSLRSTQPSG